MADIDAMIREAERRSALQFDMRPKGPGHRAAVSAIPRGERRRVVHVAAARRIAAGDFSDAAAARSDDEVRAAHARASRDRSGTSFSDRVDGRRSVAAEIQAGAAVRRHLRDHRRMGAVLRAAGGRIGLVCRRSRRAARSDGRRSCCARAVSSSTPACTPSDGRASRRSTTASKRARSSATSSIRARRCSYMIGQLKILELRDRAKAQMKDRFSERAFHNAVLGPGAVPLEMLERGSRAIHAQSRVRAG